MLKVKVIISISLTSLAEAEHMRKRYSSAESLYKKAIENAEDVLRDGMENRADAIKMDHMLSDRIGGLAIVYLENNRYEDAMDLLEPAMEKDRKKGYLIGYAMKKGSLFMHYVRHGEFEVARKIIDEIMCVSEHSGTGGGISPATDVVRGAFQEELESANQVALYKTGILMNALDGNNPRNVEAAYLKSLIKYETMHTITSTKALTSLRLLFTAQNRVNDIKELDYLAEEYNLVGVRDNITLTRPGMVQLPKRVVFCIDYSSVMAGSKIESVVDNINTAFEKTISDKDTMSIVYFNRKARFALPLTPKMGNELLIRDSLELLIKPFGKTALFDAITVSLYGLSLAPTAQDWLVVVSNSDDTASRVTLQVALNKIIQTNTAVVIIGIGEDIQTAALELLATSARRGVYFHANDDKKSISEAFGHAMQTIMSSSAVRKERK